MKNRFKNLYSDLDLDCPQIISKGLFPILTIGSIADQKRMKQYYGKNPEHRLNHLTLNDNQIIAECSSYCVDILTGTEFDVIFLCSDIKNFKNVTTVLEYSSFNRSYEVDCVPNGYSPLCIFNFPQGKPEILNKLRFESDPFDFNQYENVYLTTKEVMEKILNELDNKEEI